MTTNTKPLQKRFGNDLIETCESIRRTHNKIENHLKRNSGTLTQFQRYQIETAKSRLEMASRLAVSAIYDLLEQEKGK